MPAPAAITTRDLPRQHHAQAVTTHPDQAAGAGFISHGGAL